jgi:hypothetical protein
MSSVMRSSACGSRSARQPRPGLLAHRQRGHHAVDAGQGHAAQDERHHGAGEVVPLRQATGGDDAAVARLRQRVDERVAADGVDHGRPALLLQRLAGGSELGPVDDLGGTELAQVGGLIGLARRSGDSMAEPRQEGNGHAADTAGRPGHEHVPSPARRPWRSSASTHSMAV